MQKIVNLLNGSEDEFSKIVTEKWYVIDSKSNGSYSHHDPIKFLTKSIESSLCDYSDAYILITGNTFVTRTIAVAGDDPIQRNQPLSVYWLLLQLVLMLTLLVQIVKLSK